MKIRRGAFRKAAIAVGAGSAALATGLGVAVAEDHHLRVIAGLATIDAQAVFWFDYDYSQFNSTSCQPQGGTGGWWHCDDGAGRPALDLLKGDYTVTDTSVIGPCPADQSVDPDGGGPAPSVCGAPVYFQAYNIAPSSGLVAQVRSHGTTCSGVSVRIYTPEDLVNFIAQFEFVHMDERQVNQSTLVGPNWTTFYLGRAKYPDCIATGPHLHQSGGPEGPIIAKNSGLTAPCTLGQYCAFSPTGDYNNKWMHDLSWQTFPTPTPVPSGGGGGGGGGGGKTWWG